MDVNIEFAKRMAKVLEIFNGNVSELARQAGITPPSAKRWLTGESDPQMSNLVKLARAAGVNVQWLATGEGTQYAAQSHETPAAPASTVTDTIGNSININDFVFIPYYDVAASAGHGAWTEDEPQKSTLAFRRSWLAAFVTRHFEQLSVVSVRGDSMSGVLENGDTILINHTQTEPQDGLFALRIGNDVFVKRIQRIPNKLIIKSANPDYEPFEIDLSEENDESIAIIGKVVWLGRRI